MGFVFFLSFLSFIRNNFIIWWRIFLLITLVFVFLNKGTKSYSRIINYFIIQESLGLLFLILNINFLQFFIVMMKIGVAPLHFWIFRVTNSVFGYNLMWFLTFQKLPFLLILIQIFYLGSFFILFLGLLVCYFQIFVIKNYKNIIIISSTESFNWVVIGLFVSLFNVLYLFIYYILLIVLIINKFSKSRYNFLNWELVLVFLNIPFTVTFFVKIFSITEILKNNRFLILFLLFFIFLSILTFGYWLIGLSTKNNNEKLSNNNFLFFLIYPLILLRIIYFSSKILLYYLDKVKFLWEK